MENECEKTEQNEKKNFYVPVPIKHSPYENCRFIESSFLFLKTLLELLLILMCKYPK